MATPGAPDIQAVLGVSKGDHDLASQEVMLAQKDSVQKTPHQIQDSVGPPAFTRLGTLLTMWVELAACLLPVALPHTGNTLMESTTPGCMAHLASIGTCTHQTSNTTHPALPTCHSSSSMGQAWRHTTPLARASQ